MLDILIAVGAGLGGLVCGWLLHASKQKQSETPETTDSAERCHELASQAECVAKDELTQKSVFEVAEKLQALSMRIAANVDEHQSRVQQANLALTDRAAVPDPDAIVSVVTELIQSNQTMQGQLQEAQQRIQDQAAQIQTAEERALTDALTRIRNRRAFDDFLEKCYLDRHKGPSTLMLLDVDHFKKFNDNFGHLAGDEVLRIVASILQSRLGEMGLVARYGGEEFAVVFENRDIRSCQGAVELARRMIGEREIIFEGQRLNVTASLGLAEIDAGESLDEWVERVDRALYKAKEMGRDRSYCMEGAEPKALLAEASPQSSANASPETAKKARSGPAGAVRQLKKQTPEQGRRLHDRESLQVVFEEMKDRLKIIDVCLYFVIVRSDRRDLGEEHRRDVLTSILATTRSLGQVGVLTSGDFAICMPSANEQAALERAYAIRDAVEQCSHAESVEAATVSVGLVLVRHEDSFESMLAAASCAVQEAAEDGGSRVVIGQSVAVP